MCVCVCVCVCVCARARVCVCMFYVQPKELKTATGYTLSDLLPVISPLYTSFVENSKSDCQQGAVYRRYSRNM